MKSLLTLTLVIASFSYAKAQIYFCEVIGQENQQYEIVLLENDKAEIYKRSNEDEWTTVYTDADVISFEDAPNFTVSGTDKTVLNWDALPKCYATQKNTYRFRIDKGDGKVSGRLQVVPSVVTKAGVICEVPPWLKQVPYFLDLQCLSRDIHL